MIIGKMDKRIILQKPNLIPDGAGGYKPGTGGKWLDAGTVWAEFKTPKFSTQEVSGAVASVGIREIKIRYRGDVAKGWQVVCGTEILTINHIYHYGRAETVLVCKEVVR
jgi:SPP1 family predicted phage head-tail adaptor